MGILRYAVIGVAAFVLMPMPPEENQAANPQPVAAIQTEDLLSVAFGTFTDLASFCARQPQTCEAMAGIAAVAEAKAKYSLKLAYEWANGHSGDDAGNGSDGIPASADPAGSVDAGAASTTILKQSAADPLVTGSISKIASNDAGTNSLRIEDLIPDWRGPEPVRES